MFIGFVDWVLSLESSAVRFGLKKKIPGEGWARETKVNCAIKNFFCDDHEILIIWLWRSLSFQWTCQSSHRHNKITVNPNDQRAQSKMMKRIFLAVLLMFLFCDWNRALAASAIQVDTFGMYNSQKDRKPPEVVKMVEYFKDHEISEKQARENLRSMHENDFATPAHCQKCTAEHKSYCYSENMLKDHCCCNQSHNKGEFNEPWSYRFFVASQGLQLIAAKLSIMTPPRLRFFNHYEEHSSWTFYAKHLVLGARIARFPAEPLTHFVASSIDFQLIAVACWLTLCLH